MIRGDLAGACSGCGCSMRLQGMGMTEPGFEAFVVARGPALVRFAHSLAGSRQLGEDITQDCLIKAHRRWSSIRSDPERYLRSAIVRELVSWRRRRSNHEQPGTVPDRPVDAAVDALAEHDATWRVLRGLPVRQRAVLVLRYWEGLADREIADLLDISESSVRSSASRAFACLRQHPDLAHLTVPVDLGAQP